MTKSFILKTALALALGLVCADQARAQATGGGTKVAIVNVGEVFTKYEKAAAFKAEVEKVIGPRKAQAETLKKEMEAWQAQMKSPKFDPKEADRYQQAIIANQRKLQDMDREVRAEIGKVQEFQIISLFKDLNQAVEAVAKSQGFQLVLAYGDIVGDPFTVENISRKMNGMDLGSTTPLFFHASTNLTDTVVATLNSHYRTTTGKTTSLPK